MAARAALVGVALAVSLAGGAVAGELVVIVHPDRDVSLSESEVAQIYLKKRSFWTSGERIVPVNRDSGSVARAAFAEAVFGNDTGLLPVYWNRQYFRGVLPPATLASDEAVMRFVASEPRAIGYVDSERVDATVRVVHRLPD